MTLLITGGTGFVLSNLASRWLETDPEASVVLLDTAPWDDTIARFLAPVLNRVTFIQADVLDPATWEPLLAVHQITHIVHGATITPSPEREQANPRQILEVNTMGTVRLLEWARSQAALQRFIYVSSGAVYGEAPPGAPDAPQPEDGHVAPIELYAISKFAAEQITRRYGQIYDLDVVSVRFSGVYGPMDRETPARTVKSIPYRLTHLALAGRPIKVTSLEAGGDWIHAGDVARALAAFLRVPRRLQHPVYNVAYGEFVTIESLLKIIQEVLPSLRYAGAPERDADIIHPPHYRLGRWGAYDISRLKDEVGWTPRPMREALQSYLVWLKESKHEPDGPPSLDENGELS